MARACRAASRSDLAGDARDVLACDADESTPWPHRRSVARGRPIVCRTEQNLGPRPCDGWRYDSTRVTGGFVKRLAAVLLCGLTAAISSARGEPQAASSGAGWALKVTPLPSPA